MQRGTRLPPLLGLLELCHPLLVVLNENSLSQCSGHGGLGQTKEPPPSPRIHISSPSFVDPSLQKSLEIFSAKTPISPSTLPLDSIRFENTTIRKKKKASNHVMDRAPGTQTYTPLSTRLKNATRNLPASSPRVLRALSPNTGGS